jgi:predicted nucleotidyltransferase
VAQNTIADAVRYVKRQVAASGLAEAKVILFGSHARGTATAESDVDIAIVSPSFCGKDAFERAELTKDIEISATRKFLLPFDIVTLTPEELNGGAMIGELIRSEMAVPR